MYNSDINKKIKNIVDKLDDKDKKIKVEGKILIYNINYIKKDKIEEKNNKLTLLDFIEKEKLIKDKLYNAMTKGIPVKSINPKGKLKDFNFSFSPDLLKIYLKKPKIGTLPPKPKYTIEVPLIKDVIQNYQINNFKKSGFFNKAPEKLICFSIEQELIGDEKIPKTMVVICNNNTESQILWGCVDIIVDYIKNKCGKEYKLTLKDYKKFFEGIDFGQLTNKNLDRKKSIFSKSTVK